MKTSLLGIGISILAAALLFVGCASTPTAAEKALFNVQTNYVPKLVLLTNTVTLFQTNTVVQTVTLTNSQGVIVPVYQTNLVPVAVTTTNTVVATNMVPVYYLATSTTTTNIGNLAGTIGNIAAPGSGTIVTGLLGLLVAGYLKFRNNQFAGKNDALSQVAGQLAQEIETGRELLSSTPQGQKAADAFTQWMISHQLETGVITQVSQIVKDSTKNVEAQAAANQILALIGQPPNPPKPAA